MDEKRIAKLCAAALGEGREALTELEGLDLLGAMGLETPGHVVVRDSAGARELAARSPAVEGGFFFPGERAVVKVISRDILHKTEVGGVAIVANDGPAILGAIADMERRFALPVHGKPARVEGYTVNEFVAYEPRIGHEMIVGYRFAKDFGPVLSFGPGGIFAEYLASSFKEGAANLFLSPATADRGLVERELARNAVRTLAAGGLRNTKPAIAESAIVDVVMAFVEAAPLLAAAGVAEFEVNPFVVATPRQGGGPAWSPSTSS